MPEMTGETAKGRSMRVMSTLLPVKSNFAIAHDADGRRSEGEDQGAGTESTSKPHFMDDLLAAAGAVNVDFPLKTACCGGAHTLSDSDISTKLVLNILEAAEAAGADVIATECPTCHSGLEMHQMRAEKVLGRKTKVVMLYFTQLLGIALGLSPRALGVHENASEAIERLREKELA